MFQFAFYVTLLGASVTVVGALLFLTAVAMNVPSEATYRHLARTMIYGLVILAIAAFCYTIYGIDEYLVLTKLVC